MALSGRVRVARATRRASVLFDLARSPPLRVKVSLEDIKGMAHR